MRLAVLLTFDELRDLYGMTNIRPDQRRQIEFLLETAEEEVLAYSEVNLAGEFEEVSLVKISIFFREDLL